MSSEILIGTWAGFYSYGKEYSFYNQASKEPFEVQIKFFDGAFSGICIDIYTKNFFNQRPAMVDGVFDGKKISFIKRYPALLISDENHNTIVNWNKPSSNIKYEGRLYKKYFSGQYIFKGTWSIQDHFEENGNHYEIHGTGKWTIKKVK